MGVVPGRKHESISFRRSGDGLLGEGRGSLLLPRRFGQVFLFRSQNVLRCGKGGRYGAGNSERFSGCEPLRFWGFNRHGTRLPKSKTMKRMAGIRKKLLDRILDECNSPRMCKADMELLKSWQFQLDLNSEGESLTRVGFEELKSMAARYKKKFNTLFAPRFDESVYYFQHTNTTRTKDSFRGYAEGLFGDSGGRASALISDQVIKAFKNCAGWDSRIKRLDTWRENRKFKAAPPFQKLLREVSWRLGFSEKLNDSLVLDAYNLCRFEKAWYPKDLSSWCCLFTEEHLQILEYLDDVSYYYFGAYGVDFTPEVGCPPLKDLYEKFEEAIADPGEGPKVFVHFSHSVPTMQLYTALGLFKDDPRLEGDNYEKQKERKFRLSKIDPFASNIAVVLYRCDFDRPQRRHMVHFLINEKPVDFSDCPGGFCSWATLKEKLKVVAARCDLKLCNTTDKIDDAMDGSKSSAGRNVAIFSSPTLIASFLSIYRYF